MPLAKREILGYEYKNSTYVVSNQNKEDDAIIVKEIIHYKDGGKEPNLRIVTNYQVDFYVVLERYQNFKDKKTAFEIDKCKRYKTNQRQLTETARRVLRFPAGSGLKMLNRSPFFYGADIRPTTRLKGDYRKRWGHLKSPYSVAHLDIERDVNGAKDQREINMISVVMGNKIKQVILRSYLGHLAQDAEREIVKGFHEKVGPILESIYEPKTDELKKKYKHIKRRKYELDIEIVDHEYETVTRIFDFLHKEQPDILSIWNLSYDIKEMVTALKRANIDPADIFCDPRVPAHLREFRFVEGQPKIFDANGKGENIPPNERWHRVYAASSFFWADQMVLRRRIRKHLSKEPSSALGEILKGIFGFGKLYGDKLPSNIREGTINYHRWMQKYQKIFYAIYNIFDNVGAQLIDEYTNDLNTTFPQQCGKSDLESYASQGRRLADDLYYFLKDLRYIIGGVSDQMESELDKYSVTLDGWISTLSSHMVDLAMGNKVIEELPDFYAKVIRWVLDIDVKSSYPSTGVWSNISRETVRRVMCRIMGIDFETQRRAGLNLSSGRVNSIDIMKTLCNAPRLPTMLDRFVKREGAILRDIDED